MKLRIDVRNRLAVGMMSAAAAVMAALILFTSTGHVSAAAASAVYHQTNLVSDLPGVALIQDPDLVNPWGISMSPTSPFWVANNGSGTSTLQLDRNKVKTALRLGGIPVLSVSEY